MIATGKKKRKSTHHRFYVSQVNDHCYTDQRFRRVETSGGREGEEKKKIKAQEVVNRARLVRSREDATVKLPPGEIRELPWPALGVAQASYRPMEDRLRLTRGGGVSRLELLFMLLRILTVILCRSSRGIPIINAACCLQLDEEQEKE